MVEEFRANVGALQGMMILLYDRHFTEEEIAAMTAFYRTPAGKSMVTKLPALTTERILLGQRWGEEIARRAAERAAEQGRRLGHNLWRGYFTASLG